MQPFINGRCTELETVQNVIYLMSFEHYIYIIYLLIMTCYGCEHTLQSVQTDAPHPHSVYNKYIFNFVTSIGTDVPSFAVSGGQAADQSNRGVYGCVPLESCLGA